ncbi:EF-hand domain-containing protein D1 isoform X1 [Protopterus annectens]|uniref:EF-hand domain-containing protein D1 isoform X1 n=1 Tax=Protopterus annectens TaxID=7888 RepID=UPI001CF9C35D|nr:EF-hand domain-containing protein D1 isoform X1 [Protopterus annectens]
MASEELQKKLQRRLAIEEQDSQGEVPGSADEPSRDCQEQEKEATANADQELYEKLTRRLSINDGTTQTKQVKVFNPYTEFKEFSRKQIKAMESMFKLYDSGKDGYIDLMELKLMMEKLGAPQTHLGLKNMIKEVDEDFDGKLSFREVKALSVISTFEAELKDEQNERKRQEFEKKQRRAAFRELQASFEQ